MIGITVLIEILLIGLVILFVYLADKNWDHEFLFDGIAFCVKWLY